ncbi:OLC1v1001153C2 [Oldenlandia corymbosa var. corymbosa]|uniref:OLC1v1001153C2 n=1 Tax=Oldenlandia corymbosa var. corymbosa TaxID=529605 RepID=A0AAV1D7F4_OLDCO|nr:OLC1v1001153C2 [Oldenlandia corymbosa var. corymbosa]
MFDWNDEELSNIIWGEEGESQDHIVPYPDAKEQNSLGYGDCIKKETNQETVDIKSTEQKESTALIDQHGVKQECSSQYDKGEDFPATEFSVDSWPDQDSLGTEKCESMIKISDDASADEKAGALNKNSEIFGTSLEASEQGDFVDYSWASVGSFEDLDRIFSNEDAIFGHGALGNPEELWSSSKDVISSPEKSIHPSGDSTCSTFGTVRTAEKFGGQEEYFLDQNQSFMPGYENLNLLASDDPLDIKSCLVNIEDPGSNRNLPLKEKMAFKISGSNPSYSLNLDSGKVAGPDEYMVKGNRQKKLVKARKQLEVKSDARHVRNLQAWTQTGSQILHFNSPYVPNMGQVCSPLVFTQQGQLQGADSLQYKHPSLMSFMHRNITNYATNPVASHYHSGEGTEQPVATSYDVSRGNLNPLNQSSEAPINNSMMTPQEKIEKLRRRQQMRAMLAIQKQQQQFGNQVSSTQHSVAEGEHNESEDNLSILPSLDPNSPGEQDDSITIPLAHGDCPVQDSILYQLQDIVGKLDLRVRLCIRDSLFRLAQSASRRQLACDTSSSNKTSRDDISRTEETDSPNRLQKTSEVETETNPIDRTVAHLLFHKPPEFSGKSFEIPEVPLSVKLKASGSTSILTQSLSQRSKNNQMLSHQSPELPCLNPEKGHLKSITDFDASANASTTTDADDKNKKVEESH